MRTNCFVTHFTVVYSQIRLTFRLR